MQLSLRQQKQRGLSCNLPFTRKCYLSLFGGACCQLQDFSPCSNATRVESLAQPMFNPCLLIMIPIPLIAYWYSAFVGYYLWEVLDRRREIGGPSLDITLTSPQQLRKKQGARQKLCYCTLPSLRSSLRARTEYSNYNYQLASLLLLLLLDYYWYCMLHVHPNLYLRRNAWLPSTCESCDDVVDNYFLNKPIPGQFPHGPKSFNVRYNKVRP